MLIRTRSVAVSEVGRVREHNEDAVFADDDLGLWIVADGMGGHASGEVASQMAVASISQAVRSGISLENAIQSAHREIIASGEANPAQHGMGTTVVALQRSLTGFKAAWVGDSRIYVVETGGELNQLNYDHSFVQDMVFRGVLTEEEAATHEKKNLINQALGMTNLETLRVGELSLQPETMGMFLLCSDGVSDMLSPDSMADILDDSGSPLEERSARLGAAVMATDASDNFTFIALDYKPQTVLRWGNNLRNWLMNQA